MTPKATKDALRAAIEFAWHKSAKRIDEMRPQRRKREVALLIAKNRGYQLALEDVTDLLYAHKVY